MASLQSEHSTFTLPPLAHLPKYPDGQTQCSQSRLSGFTFTGTPVSADCLGSAVKAVPQPVTLAIDTHLTLETPGSKH